VGNSAAGERPSHRRQSSRNHSISTTSAGGTRRHPATSSRSTPGQKIHAGGTRVVFPDPGRNWLRGGGGNNASLDFRTPERVDRGAHNHENPNTEQIGSAGGLMDNWRVEQRAHDDLTLARRVSRNPQTVFRIWHSFGDETHPRLPTGFVNTGNFLGRTPHRAK